jgi:hypothetical protein
MDFSLQRSGMKRFDLFISHDIALRWSVNRWLAVKSIKHLAPLEPEH